MRPLSRARIRATAMTTGRLFGTLALIMACVACDRFGHYTLVSPEYGFCVTFPEKPSKLSDKNREGLRKHLWTVYRPDRKDFYSRRRRVEFQNSAVRSGKIKYQAALRPDCRSIT
jgi:hypothetical protein